MKKLLIALVAIVVSTTACMYNDPSMMNNANPSGFPPAFAFVKNANISFQEIEYLDYSEATIQPKIGHIANLCGTDINLTYAFNQPITVFIPEEMNLNLPTSFTGFYRLYVQAINVSNLVKNDGHNTPLSYTNWIYSCSEGDYKFIENSAANLNGTLPCENPNFMSAPAAPNETTAQTDSISQPVAGY